MSKRLDMFDTMIAKGSQDPFVHYARAMELRSLERFTRSNGSSLEGHLELSRAHRDAGDDAETKKSLDELFATWRQLPGYQRRKQVGTWLRAGVMRLFGF